MPEETKLDILLREYESLRAEILERLKLAYQHLGWAGGLIAFAIPLAASDLSSLWLTVLKVGVAVSGVLLLVWLSILNWLWLRNCADQVRRIEEVVETHFGGAKLLTWERRVKNLSKGVLRIPKNPATVLSPVPCLSSPATTAKSDSAGTPTGTSSNV